jgi:type IV pilus assembly protein PilQ
VVQAQAPERVSPVAPVNVQPNAVERIDATQTSTGIVVTVVLKAPAGPLPASFSTSNPSRIALDLPQTINALGRNLVEVNQGDLRSVNVVQAAGRTRLVLNLKRTVSHAVSVDGNTIQIALGGAVEFQLSTQGDTPFAQDQTWYRGILYCDGGPRHEASFGYYDTLLVA